MLGINWLGRPFVDANEDYLRLSFEPQPVDSSGPEPFKGKRGTEVLRFEAFPPLVFKGETQLTGFGQESLCQCVIGNLSVHPPER